MNLDYGVVDAERITTVSQSHGRGHCFESDTRVLARDLSWKPIIDVEVGEELIGASKKEDTGYMEIQPTTVEATDTRMAETVEMITEKTSVKVTPDHEFYRKHRGYEALEKELNVGTKYRVAEPIISMGQPDEAEMGDQYKRGWMYGVAAGDGTFVNDAYYGNSDYVQKGRFSLRVRDREIVDRFVSFGEEFWVDVHVSPWENDSQALLYKSEDIRWLKNLDAKRDDYWYRGFLGGFFDAEGSFDGINLRIAQKEGEELDLAKEALGSLGIQYKEEDYKNNGVHTLLVNGGRGNVIHFFSTTYPVLQRKKDNLFGHTLNHSQEIAKVKERGEHRVYGLRTGTHNFISNGLLAHNCCI